MDPLPCMAHTMHGSWWLDEGASINTLRPRQNGRHFADDTFKRIFLNDNVRISIRIPLKFVLYGPIYCIPALVQIMAWRRPGDKPLSEPMMVWLPTHICFTRPQYCPVSVGISRSQHQQTDVLRSEQTRWLTADDIFRCISLNTFFRLKSNFSEIMYIWFRHCQLAWHLTGHCLQNTDGRLL